MSVLNPYHMNTSLTNYAENDIQQNGIDLQVSRIFSFLPRIDTPFILYKNGDKQHQETHELIPDENEFWKLISGYYQVEFLNKICVDVNECGFVISRSTLIRNGLKIISGLYDSGYNGKMVAGLEINSPVYVKIQKRARLGQYISFNADSYTTYKGSYQEGAGHGLYNQ